MRAARRPSLVPFVVRFALAVALWSIQALSTASWIRAFQYADDDSGNTVRLARECLEQGVCVAAGNPTSALGFSHGASWTRLIRYCLAAGGGLPTVQTITVVLLVAATIVTSMVVWRTVSWRAGMIASLLVLPSTLATFRFDNFGNGTLLPLPLTLYYASTVWFMTSRRTVAALVASVWLALAMSPELECVLAAPFHMALVALVATRPLSAATGAALTVAVTFAIESSAAAAQLGRGLFRPSIFALGLLLLTGVAAALSTSGRRLLTRILASVEGWRRRLRDMPARVRSRVAMKLAALYLLTAVWIGSMFGIGRIPDAHHFAPAVFPLVFLVADAAASMSDRRVRLLMGVLVLTPVSLLAAPLVVALGGMLCMLAGGVSLLFVLAAAFRSRSRLLDDLEAPLSAQVGIAGAVLVCLMCAPDALIYPRSRQLWPIGVTEKIVRDLYTSGLTYAGLMGALQGPAYFTIQTMIVNLDPALFTDAPRAGETTSSLLAMIVDPRIAALTHDVLVRVDTGGKSAVVIRSPSLMDRARVRTCSTRSCTDPVDPERCTTRDPDGRIRHSAPFFPLEGPDVARAGGPTYCVRFFIPLRMSGTGEAHWVRTEQLWPLDIRIRQVSGVSFDGPLPGPEIRLSNDHPGTGSIEIEIEAHTYGPNPFIEQPPVIEVTNENAHLLDAFRKGRVTLF